MIDYFRNKQVRLIQAIPSSFIRHKYMELLKSPNRLVGLVGQRGVGKTTLLLQYIKHYFKPNAFLYVSADDIYISDKKLYDIADEFVKLSGKILVIDEIHKYMNWAQELKNIYDSFPDLLIRFSGSSMLRITYEKYDLSRRCVTNKMETLSFNEYLALNSGIHLSEVNLNDLHERGSEISQDLIFSHAHIYSDFKDYIKIGAYPFFMEDKLTFKNKLFNAQTKIINEDIQSCHKIDYSHISIFKKLIARLIESRVPYKVNISKISSEMGISPPTLMTYFTILQDSNVFRPIKKYSDKVSVKPEKLLFHNTNILHAYAEEFGIEVNIGTERETFFASCFPHIFYSTIGDFRFQDVIYEIGGRNKSFKQITDLPNSFLVIDTDYTTDGRIIPLWLFGMMK